MPLKPSRGLKCLGGENLILDKSFDQNRPAYLLLHLGFEFFFSQYLYVGSFCLFLISFIFFLSLTKNTSLLL